MSGKQAYLHSLWVRNRFRGGCPRPAFSLIELLASIGVVLILAAILVPVIGRVRESAHISQCSSNLRQLGVAMAFYAQEHEGEFPLSKNGPMEDGRNYAERLVNFGYMPEKAGAFTCPADPSYIRDLVPTGAEVRSYSYISPAMAPSYSVSVARRLESIPEPGRVAMITEWHSPRGQFQVRDHAGSVVGPDIVADDTRAANSSGHRGGARNFLFFDGHVEYLSVEDSRHAQGRAKTNLLWGYRYVGN